MYLGSDVWHFQEELQSRTTCIWRAQARAIMESVMDQLSAPLGLAIDAWHTKKWRDKLRLWLMPTGWRPADVKKVNPQRK